MTQILAKVVQFGSLGTSGRRRQFGIGEGPGKGEVSRKVAECLLSSMMLNVVARQALGRTHFLFVHLHSNRYIACI